MYNTSQIAKLIGIHPNTVRFYEEMELLPPIPRQDNNYRVFQEFHLEQLKLIRIAFSSEIISGNLRKMTIEVIKLSAKEDFAGSILKTHQYLEKIADQKKAAKEAITVIEEMMTDKKMVGADETLFLTRREAAASLDITVDVLRNWERNGLINIPRQANRYRRYGSDEMNRLKIISTLRNANYSMMSILRLLSQIDQEPVTDFEKIIDTPLPTEDIVSVTDRFITSLEFARENGNRILKQLIRMEKLFAGHC